MEIIKSLDNSQIKAVCKLKDRKYRQQFNKYIIEGERNVKDSLPYLKNAKIYVSESAYSRFENQFTDVTVCSDLVFAKMCETSNSQGVIAVADIEQKPLDFTQNCVFLDRISDPGNLGTIMRSCVATEFNNIVVYSGVDCFNSKTVRSAMSAVSKLNVCQTSDLSTLGELKKQGYCVVCADMSGENVYKAQLNSVKMCLIIGNEANGISDEVLSYADKIVSLPMGKVESLNAGVCASIMMYEFKYGK